MTPGRWNDRPLKLLCFPPAGGSVSAFAGWSHQLPPPIVVLPIELPGHGERAGEPALAQLGALVELLTAEIVPHLCSPYALFGHSLGALIAFEVARGLRTAGALPPVAVYASGLAAPHLLDAYPSIHSAPDDQFVRELRRRTDTRWEELEDRRLRRYLLPVLRADVELCESYQHLSEEPLSCPLRVFGGSHDDSVRPPELVAWQQHTTGQFRLDLFTGDHSFPVTDRDAMLRVLGGDLLQLLAPEEDGDRDVAYRSAQLADVGVLGLPTDNPRAPTGRCCPQELEFEVADSVTEALRGSYGRDSDGLLVPLLAAFAVLLARYSEQDDVVIGLLPDRVALRVGVDGELRFPPFLRHVGDVILAAREHSDLIFDRLVYRLPPGDPSRRPLFQVAFRFDDEPPAETVVHGSEPVDLALALEMVGGALRGRLTYDASLYEDSTAARVIGSYLALLGGITADGEATLGALPLLSAEDRQKVLETWNDTTVVDGADVDLISQFEAAVAASPTAVAFFDATSTVTFAELGREANRLAHHLASLGVGPEVPVGVCVERSCDIPVLLLAVWKAGGAWLPLDPSYPAERLRFMLDDAGATVLVTSSQLAHLFPEDPARRTVRLDHDRHHIAQGPATDPGARPGARQLASITYTSGSTGRPKGVAVEHRQILNRLSWMWESYSFDPGEVGAQVMATSFVDSLWELLGPLLCGVPTVIVPIEQARSLTGLVDTLAAAGATRLWLVPSHLRALLDTHPDLRHRLPRLRFWVSTGESLPLDLYDRFQALMPHATLYNLYGTSEVWDATWYDPRCDGAPRWRVPVGRPIRNVQAYVLDRWRQPVPPGVAGELYVGGQGLARGYLGLPDLTTEVFVPHPFDEAPAARLYRTGDRARHLPDGSLELLGRRDDQLSLRGFRIEPGEVEDHLRAHPAVRDAAVAAETTPAGDLRLVAYVVARVAPGAGRAELRAHLAERLPPYSVPNAFVHLDSLPLTPSGKVDYRRLPAGPAGRWSAEASYAAPRTAVEAVVADLWRDVLHEPHIGIHDDFFAGGGHSLLAARIVSELQRLFRVDLPLRRLFETPTVAGLVAALIEDPRTRSHIHATAERLVGARQGVR